MKKWLVPLLVGCSIDTAPSGFVGWLQTDIFVDRPIGLDEFTGVACGGTANDFCSVPVDAHCTMLCLPLDVQ